MYKISITIFVIGCIIASYSIMANYSTKHEIKYYESKIRSTKDTLYNLVDMLSKLGNQLIKDRVSLENKHDSLLLADVSRDEMLKFSEEMTMFDQLNNNVLSYVNRVKIKINNIKSYTIEKIKLSDKYNNYFLIGFLLIFLSFIKIPK